MLFVEWACHPHLVGRILIWVCDNVPVIRLQCFTEYTKVAHVAYFGIHCGYSIVCIWCTECVRNCLGIWGCGCGVWTPVLSLQKPCRLVQLLHLNYIPVQSTLFTLRIGECVWHIRVVSLLTSSPCGWIEPVWSSRLCVVCWLVVVLVQSVGHSFWGCRWWSILIAVHCWGWVYCWSCVLVGFGPRLVSETGSGSMVMVDLWDPDPIHTVVVVSEHISHVYLLIQFSQ